MRLVIDTNIVFSLFKPRSYVNSLLSERQFTLYAPQNMIEELSRYSTRICSKAGISKETFNRDVDLLCELINLQNASKSMEEKASELLPHKTHTKNIDGKRLVDMGLVT